ncbi:hypothetical protein CVS40_11878 [Lucilia cuprina]|nr:hypothetical protein CVS40_11878 [Lucilia cuprina]
MIRLSQSKTFYVPHFAVKNPNKDDIRVVFDAASKVQGISLNYALLSGPDLINSLISVYFIFTEAPVAVCGDIRIKNDDINSQRFLWRGLDYNDSIQHCTFSEISPRAKDAIIYSHYVEDYVDYFQSDSEVIEVVTENVIDAFHVSNVCSVDVSMDEVERILGLAFLMNLFLFRVTENIIIELRSEPTKRDMLSYSSELNWDDEMPDCLNGRRVALLCEIKKVKDYKISHCHFYNFCNTVNELHLLSDASEQAMAVVEPELKRAIAWIMRFINNSKISENKGRIKGELSVEEDYAEKILCRMVQQTTVHSEYKCLQVNKTIEARSDLKTLCPYLDDFGLLRVYGRIDKAPFVAIARIALFTCAIH